MAASPAANPRAATPLDIRPPALRPGDLVGIVAVASPVREELLRRGEERLEALGLTIRRAPHLLARSRYTAGSVDERAADLLEMLRDDDVRAIFVARGGYGSPPILPLLDPTLLRTRPKLLIGASDATALLLWSLAAGVRCLHGPMPAMEMQQGRVDFEELRRHLMESVPFGTLDAPGARVLHPGRGTGRLTGGCLSLVIATLATPWEIDTQGAILFLEDADTKPYQIDRMLTQLRHAGKLAQVSGIAFGEMPRCLQNEAQGYTLDEVLRDLTADLGVPVLTGLPCGHTFGVHRPLPLGVTATLDGAAATLTFEEALVAPRPS